jgi:hypothetical protein
MSDQRGGLKGEYIEPSDQLTLKTLAAEIYGKAIAYVDGTRLLTRSI